MNSKALAGLAGTALLAFLAWVGVTTHQTAVSLHSVARVVSTWHCDEVPPGGIEVDVWQSNIMPATWVKGGLRIDQTAPADRSHVVTDHSDTWPCDGTTDIHPDACRDIATTGWEGEGVGGECDCQAAAFRFKAIKYAVRLMDEGDSAEARAVLIEALTY